MPVEVIKYTCAFRCGQKANGNIKRVSAHEKKCWNNPDNKTCKTCSNEIYHTDGDGYKNWIVRDCKLSALSDTLSDCHDILSYNNTMHIRPIYNCKYHNSIADENINEFAELLKAEMLGDKEGTEHYPFFDKPKIVEQKIVEDENTPF